MGCKQSKIEETAVVPVSVQKQEERIIEDFSDLIDTTRGYQAKIALIVGISNYSELRKQPKREGFKDLTETIQDVKTVDAGLKSLGFTAEERIKLVDPAFDQFQAQLDDIME